MEFISHSAAETEKFAADMAAKLICDSKYGKGDEFCCVIALFGGMGAGKTAFVKGFARGAGFTGEGCRGRRRSVAEAVGRIRLL